MLYYKAWVETRWRFGLGLVVLLCAAAMTVLYYDRLLALLPQLGSTNLDDEVKRQITRSAELMRDFRGYIWSQWFLRTFPQTWSIFAGLLGSGGLIHSSRGGALYMMSMPVSRTRLLATRAAVGLAEIFALAMVPALAIPLLAPLAGYHYAIGDALAHGLLFFISGAAYFALAFFLSTQLTEVWRPFVSILVVSFVDQLARDRSWPASLFQVMSAEPYFRGTGLPWIGLVVSVGLSIGFFYAAHVSFSRRDF
jgi:ABC-type transport system involved in multi-copper enzyme maturation permease subunit